MLTSLLAQARAFGLRVQEELVTGREWNGKASRRHPDIQPQTKNVRQQRPKTATLSSAERLSRNCNSRPANVLIRWGGLRALSPDSLQSFLVPGGRLKKTLKKLLKATD